jgi:hypothetical protein
METNEIIEIKGRVVSVKYYCIRRDDLFGGDLLVSVVDIHDGNRVYGGVLEEEIVRNVRRGDVVYALLSEEHWTVLADREHFIEHQAYVDHDICLSSENEPNRVRCHKLLYLRKLTL